MQGLGPNLLGNAPRLEPIQFQRREKETSSFLPGHYVGLPSQLLGAFEIPGEKRKRREKRVWFTHPPPHPPPPPSAGWGMGWPIFDQSQVSKFNRSLVDLSADPRCARAVFFAPPETTWVRLKIEMPGIGPQVLVCFFSHLPGASHLGGTLFLTHSHVGVAQK